MTVTPSALDPRYAQAGARVDQAADQQMAWNRPNTANPWAAQTSNPDGSVSLGFTGPLAGAQGNLTAQALRSLGSPMDYTQFNSGSGDDFRNQGIAGAQSQFNDWLSPLQGGFDNSDRQRALAAGFQEGTPQYDAQMQKGAGSAADLQSTLHNAAIGLGGQMGAKQQAMDLLAKQQGLSEALRQRSLPMEQLSGMRGLLQQPGYNPDGSIMGGATSGLTQTLGNYWRQRGMSEKEQADATNTALGIIGSVESLVPVAGGFMKSGSDAFKVKP